MSSSNVFANLHTSPTIYKGFIIPVQFNKCGKTFRALVDTGADYTLLSHNVLDEIQDCGKDSKRIRTQPNWPMRLENFGIRDASGNRLSVFGYANGVSMYVKGSGIGGVVLPPGVPVIKDLSPEIILGHDALALMSTRIEYGDDRDNTTIQFCDKRKNKCTTLNMGRVRRDLMKAQSDAVLIGSKKKINKRKKNTASTFSLSCDRPYPKPWYCYV